MSEMQAQAQAERIMPYCTPGVAVHATENNEAAGWHVEVNYGPGSGIEALYSVEEVDAFLASMERVYAE